MHVTLKKFLYYVVEKIEMGFKIIRHFGLKKNVVLVVVTTMMVVKKLSSGRIPPCDGM